MNNNRRDMIAPMGNGEKGNFTSYLRPDGARSPGRKLSARAPMATNRVEDELARLRTTKAEVQRIRISAQRELELAKQMRVKAERYRQETEAKARSQAQLLILHARLATQKEIAELKRKTNEEIQKVLADIHIIRIAAREELEAQRILTSAARIRALSLSLQEEAGERSENEEEAIGV